MTHKFRRKERSAFPFSRERRCRAAAGEGNSAWLESKTLIQLLPGEEKGKIAVFST
jgi:hypothetical protein